MNKQADDEANKPWLIRDVPEHTRRAVKSYAVQHGMTVAQALEHLIDRALGLSLTMTTKEGDGSESKLDLTTLTGQDREEVKLLAEALLRIMEIQKRKSGEGKAE